jgi:hypothetical protein
MAIENGLNDENSISNVSPFEAEMRRRLWWQIFILDIRNAETGGSEPHIMESQMRTKFPSNVSDTDLDPDMSHIPKSHSGKSEMLFSLVRLEVSYFARLILFSYDFNKKNTYPIMSASEKCEAIDRFEERIELERVSHCDMSIPLDFVTAASCRLILAKLRLTVRKPQNRNSQQVLTQESFRQDCMEVLERAKTLRLHERGKLWRWLFQTYVEWDALTYLYISLSLSPSRHKGDVALAAAEDIYQYWKFKNESRGCSRWAHIEELHTQALVAKELIQANPSSFGTSSNDTVRLEDSESITTGSHESASSAVTQAPIPGTMLPLALSVIQSVQQPGSSRDPERQFNQIDGGQNAQTAQEPLHIPSSGTACQWSTALFERYFEVLGLEQEGIIS